MKELTLTVSKSCITQNKLTKYGYKRYYYEKTNWFKGLHVFRKNIGRRKRIEIDVEKRTITAQKNKPTWIGAENWVPIPIKRKWVEDIQKYIVLEGQFYEHNI